jgi:hypothetical protein
MRYYFLLILLLLIPVAVAINTTNSSDRIAVPSIIIEESDNVTNSTDLLNETSYSMFNQTQNNSQSEDEVVIQDVPLVDSSDSIQPLTRTIVHPKNSFSMAGVKAQEVCSQKSYQTVEPVLTTCEVEVLECDDLDNTSCINTTQLRNDCQVNTRIITHVQDVCTPVGFTILDTYDLPLTDYECSIDGVEGVIVAVCDSRNDGNGDGICHPGESCMRFEFTNEGYTQEFKNSKDDFRTHDRTYFLESSLVEVRK